MSGRQDIIRLATRTQVCHYKLWGFGEAVAMNGLLEASRHTGVPDFANFVHRCVDLWMAEYPEDTSPCDHVAPGVALLILYEQHRDERLLARARSLVRSLLSAPRATSGLPLTVPERPDGVYVDCIYTEGPLLARLANVTGDRELHTSAVEHALKQIEALRDPEDLLFYHARDERFQKRSQYPWGRGNGWALMGLVDLLAELPPDIEGRAQIQAALASLVDRMVALQDASGHWHTVLNRKDSYLEPSVAAMFTAGVHQAIELNMLSREYQRAVDAAWQAVQGNLQPGGRYPGSDATDIGDFCYYSSLPLTINPWCMGPALLAVCRRTPR